MELKDPEKTRKINTTPLPFQRSLTANQLFQGDIVDWKLLQRFLKREGRLTKPLFLELVQKAHNILRDEPNLIELQDPITIVGDIHGQFYDLLKVLDPQTGGPVDATKFLFLGDYVDRGSFSIEVIALVLALKISFPKTIFLLRGNHQCRQLTSFFNFRTECLEKYDQQVYNHLMDLFDNLPLAAIVNKKFLCLHGGISQEIKSIEEIRKISRVREIPKSGIFCDLMWADPVDNNQGKMEALVQPNDVRGCSYFFGEQIAKQFLTSNNLLSVIRAHEAQANGFKMYHWAGQKQFPTVITIFSAPNYCDFYNNKGAVIKFKNNTLDIQQFLQSPHPYYLPNFMDVFSWSIPFVAEKVTQMLYKLIKPDQLFNDDEVCPIELIDKQQIIAKLLEHQHIATQENINFVTLDGRTLDPQLVKIEEAREYTKKQYKKSFDKKKEIDSRNEKRPPEEKVKK